MLTFYATVNSDSIRNYMPDVPYMLPASSWARKGMRAPRLPAHVTHTAADCGGYVATKIWGGYRYTPAQYVDWLASFQPRWAATMDYCCEPDLPVVTRERQERTSEMAYHFWREYRNSPWVWVPTVQGWTVSDYMRHARELRTLIREMADHYGTASSFRVGIGTLCRRANVETIRAVIRAVTWELPGVPLHLWGVKYRALSPALAGQLASVDSAAWESRFGRDIEEWRASRLSERAYAYTVALPRYRARVEECCR